MTDVEIGVTQTLKGFLQKSPEQFKTVSAAIEHYIREYQRALSTVDAKSTAHSFHNVIDDLISDTRATTRKNQPVCKKGCSHCCYIQVDVTPDEAELLFSYINHENIPVDWDLLERQSALGEFGNLPFSDRRCTFLNERGECRVYRHRPMACRKYLVGGDPKRCDSQRYPRGDVKIYSCNRSEVVASAVYSLRGAKLMGRALLDLKGKGAQ